MGHPLRWFIPGLVYEVTTRTIQERYLLTPTAGARELVIGVLGRGLALYPEVRLHAFAYLSNHCHLLVSSSDGQALAWFLGYVNSNVAREMGRLHGWRGPFWGRRCRPIPILDESAQIERLRYIMSQGIKEGLVASPVDWPGASAVAGLVGDMRVEGIWIDRDLETRARVRVHPPARATYEAVFAVELEPIPAWRHLSRDELVARHRTLLTEIEAVYSARRTSPVLGPAAIASQNPYDRTEDPDRRPAPLCHASTRSIRVAFKAAYAAFVTAFRRASFLARDAVANGVEVVAAAIRFPPGSFPRPGWFQSAPANAWAALDLVSVRISDGGHQERGHQERGPDERPPA